MFLIPSFKKIKCCFLMLFIILGMGSLLFGKSSLDIWNRFYNLENFTKNLPGLGSLVELPDFKIKVQRIERIENQANPKSDFSTLLVETIIESKLFVNTLIFELFDIWIEDKLGNKFELSTMDKRNQILADSEVASSGALQIQAYFSIPKYSKELYLVIKPKIAGKPAKIKL